MGRFIGIDFGTLSCRTAVYKDGTIEIIPNRFSEGRMPYLIENSKKDNLSLDANKGEIPYISFSSIKQKIGFEETVLVEGKKVLTIDIASDIFSAINEDASGYISAEIDGAVVTVPSCFT